VTIRITQADCELHEWPELDVLITDPPYTRHVHSNATSQSAGGGTRSRDLGFGHLTPKLRRTICRLASQTRRWIVIYSACEDVTWWRLALQAAGCTYIRTIPWVRWSMPQLSGDRPPQGCELLIIAYGHGKGRKHWNGPGNLTHLAHTCLRGDGKHKAEKPLDQLLDLVEWFSDPGELVGDPCTGSGTAAVACTILGRRFEGTELDPKWAEHASVRAEQATCGVLDDRDTVRSDKWAVAKDAARRDTERRIAINQRQRDRNEAAKTHNHLGNCEAPNGVSPVGCEEHEAPRGACPDCPRCLACEADRKRGRHG
jgi:hypothetical protein